MTVLLAQIATVFGAGVLASFSPCVYPMIPISLGFLSVQAKSGSRSRIFLFAFGQISMLIALGVGAVQLGESLGFTGSLRSVQIVMGVVLLLAGILSLSDRSLAFLTGANQWQNKINFRRFGPNFGAFLFGAGSALLMSPCTTPILGGVLALIATAKTVLIGVGLMTAYAVGFTLLFIALGFGAFSLKALPKSGLWLSYLHKVGALALMGFGGYYIYLGFM